jgi:hypothetical protein
MRRVGPFSSTVQNANSGGGGRGMRCKRGVQGGEDQVQKKPEPPQEYAK